MKHWLCGLLAALLLAALLVGCGATDKPSDATGDSTASDGKLNVVTTIFPPYDFVRQIAGDAVSLTMLLSPGNESHDFEPTLSDAATVEAADLFVYIGGESDENWVPDLLASVSDTNTLALTDCVSLNEEETVEGMQKEQEAEEAEGVAYDEHVWTSPKNAIKIVQALCDALCSLDPDNADLYQTNTAAYVEELHALDADFEALVANAARNTILFEGRFPFRYLCADYGLQYYAALAGCAADTEVSLSTISFLIDQTKEQDIPVVFYIEFSKQTVADAICDSTGAKKLLLHSCHNVSPEDFDHGVTYIDLMRQNLDHLQEALN
ncbi:MAG: metal ABC transporter substrate-binding protein [Oscillospiraceae bacterium]|jgi:zinc transport system substrate-binding protein